MLIFHAITSDKIAKLPSDPVSIERLRRIEEQSRKDFEKWQEYFKTHKDEWPICSVKLS